MTIVSRDRGAGVAGSATRLGSEPAAVDLHDDGALPPALAFLVGIIDTAVLRAVATEAERADVSADVVLLNEGHMAADAYYRRLAEFLGVAFAERPLRLADTTTIEDALVAGALPLKPNAKGWRYLAAPRGPALVAFIAVVLRRSEAAKHAVVLTTPDRLEALLRFERRAAVVKAGSHALADWNPSLSARNGLSAAQAGCAAAALASVLVSAFEWPWACLIGLHLVFFVAFGLLVTLRLVATAASPEPRVSEADRMPDHALPVYTIVVPLYREAKMVERLVVALDALDYPAAKLDIILVVESNDVATLDAIERLRLPGRYRTLVAPRGRPQTKPRALNLALQFARGAFLVVYDAEDEPEAGQLRAALSRFAEVPSVACLQAKLAIDNAGDGWLTRLFAIEYAALFDVINPGFAALGLPVPLGGTSNHFRMEVLRRLNGWDAWNVTEDIDLGIRLARFGCRVETLDSTTFEEAPNRLKPWLAQRSRWLKGWIVTLGTHSRHPRRLAADLGPASTLAALALLFGTVASCLLGPFFIVMTALHVWSGDLLYPRSLAETLWRDMSVVLLTAGALSLLWPALLGLQRRRALRLAGWLFLTPAYLMLLSVACGQALFEAAGRPFAWTKTEHGRAKRRIRPGSAL